MIIKTKEFKEAASTILLAVDSCNMYAANLELLAKNNTLLLNVTNKEYYCSVKFLLEEEVNFRAVVDANLFLSLISGITTETFTLEVKENVIIKSGKSSYKLAMIYENDNLMTLQPIVLNNKTVEMSISNDILKSILNINSKELVKVKNLDVNPLQKCYYITEEGCLTFTTGACLNAFTLEKQVEFLLNDRIVKLFKLFKDDVSFAMAQDVLQNNVNQTKISFQTKDVYLAALIANDKTLLNKIKGPCNSTKALINMAYTNRLVLSVNQLSASVSRLMLFTKNSIEDVNMLAIPATFTILDGELTIADSQGNIESVAIENDSYSTAGYEMVLNLSDLKLILDSCKDDFITLNCGNHRSVVLNRGCVSNLIPEAKRAGDE